jgi:hypothetical protein
MRLEFSGQIFEKYSYIKFRENPSNGSRVIPCGRTDMTKLIIGTPNFANVPNEAELVCRRIMVCTPYQTLFGCSDEEWDGGGAVAYRGGGVGVFNPPPPPKFRSFDKAEPNSQFRGKYIPNNLTRIRLSLIYWVVSWKALPASYDLHSGIFFLSKAWRDVSIKYQKLRKFYHMKWKFLYEITAASRTPD